MGKNLEQILTELGDGDTVGVTLATNQDNGIVGYAIGNLLYHAGSNFHLVKLGPGNAPPSLSTAQGAPLDFYFSDRHLDIDPPSPPGTFGHSKRQPFSANARDKLAMSINLGVGARIVNLTFITWNNATAHVAMQPSGNVLVGVGTSLGESREAVYVLSFNGISKPPH